jgi:hypothetical protein
MVALEIPQPKRLIFSQDKESKLWMAHCVDFYLLATAKTPEDLPKAFGHVYFGEILVAFERGLVPSFPDAPDYIKSHWANRTERCITAVKKLPWSLFVPAWAPAAFGKLLKQYSKPEEIEVKAPAGVSC